MRTTTRARRRDSIAVSIIAIFTVSLYLFAAGHLRAQSRPLGDAAAVHDPVAACGRPVR